MGGAEALLSDLRASSSRADYLPSAGWVNDWRRFVAGRESDKPRK